MREIGIQPDILICRSDRPLAQGLKEKIALFSNVAVDSVISAVDVSCIYELPLVLHAEGLDNQIAERLNIWSRQPDLSNWIRVVERFKMPAKGSVRIGVVGKYVHLKDSYKSLNEALVAGGLAMTSPFSSSTSTRSRSNAAARPRCSVVWTPSWFPAASVIAAWKARFPPSATRANRACRSSEFAWECSLP